MKLLIPKILVVQAAFVRVVIEAIHLPQADVLRIRFLRVG